MAAERAERGDPLQDDDALRKARPLIFMRVRAEFLAHRKLPDLPGEQARWYWGPGAFRRAREEYPDAFVKNCDKWWDGYNDEEVVITKCFLGKNAPPHEVRQWGERHPFRAQVQRGRRYMTIRPQIVIVTSALAPAEIWKHDHHMVGGLEWRYEIVEVE